MPDHQPLPVVILACKVFQNLIEQYIPAQVAREFIFLDYGLHRVPKNLRIGIQERIDAIQEPSLILLGYGLCGNGLDGIRAGIHTLVIPRTDDCIAILLGSYAAYRREFDESPGTYYLTKGWLESGSNPLKEYEEYVVKYGAAKADWLIDSLYHNYRRLAFVAHQQRDIELYREAALRVAEFSSRWNIQYQEILGSDQYVRKLGNQAGGIDPDDEDFLIIRPGGVLTQHDFLRIL